MSDPFAPRTPAVLSAELYIALLPLGHLLYVPVAGAWATAADLVLLPLLVATALELLASSERGDALAAAIRGQESPMPPRRYLLGVLVLLAFAGWVALSGLWGFHARYAAVKGVGLGALVLGAAAVAISGIGWKRASHAWLVGAAAALGVTLIGALIGPDVLRGRVIYEGGGVVGLPFPRISGPLVHPNMMGDYLVVTGVLIWGVWEDLSAGAKRWGAVLAVAVAGALFLTASTGWIAAGLAMMLVGRQMTPSGTSRLLRVGGLLVSAAVLVTVLVPVDMSVAGVELHTSGIRPRIWQGAVAAIVDAPIFGVGAAPFLAEAVDPLDPAAGAGLWDAHNAYLSVWGQFGVVGLVLLGTGVWLMVSAPASAQRPRSTTALHIALGAVAVHALFVASEDLRHVWLLLGLVGAARLWEPSDG